jgi:hypothetical protein
MVQRRDRDPPDLMGVKANKGYKVNNISLAKHMAKFEIIRARTSFVSTENREGISSGGDR